MCVCVCACVRACVRACVLPHLVQALQAFDAMREQLFALRLCHYPLPWGIEVAPTLFAPHHSCLLLDWLCDVNLRAYAVDTHI